jgi:hypothetical protein
MGRWSRQLQLLRWSTAWPDDHRPRRRKQVESGHDSRVCPSRLWVLEPASLTVVRSEAVQAPADARRRDRGRHRRTCGTSRRPMGAQRSSPGFSTGVRREAV